MSWALVFLLGCIVGGYAIYKFAIAYLAKKIMSNTAVSVNLAMAQAYHHVTVLIAKGYSTAQIQTFLDSESERLKTARSDFVQNTVEADVDAFFDEDKAD